MLSISLYFHLSISYSLFQYPSPPTCKLLFFFFFFFFAVSIECIYNNLCFLTKCGAITNAFPSAIHYNSLWPSNQSNWRPFMPQFGSEHDTLTVCYFYYLLSLFFFFLKFCIRFRCSYRLLISLIRFIYRYLVNLYFSNSYWWISVSFGLLFRFCLSFHNVWRCWGICLFLAVIDVIL